MEEHKTSAQTEADQFARLWLNMSVSCSDMMSVCIMENQHLLIALFGQESNCKGTNCGHGNAPLALYQPNQN